MSIYVLTYGSAVIFEDCGKIFCNNYFIVVVDILLTNVPK